MDFLTRLFDTSDFPPRWHCGNWTAGHGWLHILSDLGVWSAYIAIPCVLGYFVLRRKDIPFRTIFWLFGAFILACGTTHLMEALIFWWPAYRLAAVIKLFTAVVSWGTVLALVPVVPKVLAMRSPEELEREIAGRKQAEDALQKANADLEQKVQERTVELAKANATLRYEREMLRITLASIGDAVIATDVEGQVTFLNSVAQSLTGWKEGDAKGQPLEGVFRIVNEKNRKAVVNPALRALKEGAIVGLANHTILIARNGTERTIDDSAAPIRHEDGTVAGAVLVFRDVTEQRKTERLVRSLAAIVESSDDAIIGKDLNGVITSWNQGAQRIFGYTAAEAIGRPVAMLAPPDRADDMPAILARIKRGERIDHFDTVRRAKDGRLLPISLTVSPIKDEDGEVVGASKIARDISERKRAEEALHEEKAQLHATLTGIGDAVIVTDAERRVTLMNPVAQTLTGWSEEAMGRPLEEVFRIINEQTCQPVENPVSRVVREGTIVGLANHTALVAKDGTERPIEDSAAPIQGADGQIVGVVLVFRDATEQRRAEEELRRSEAQLRQIADSMAQIVWTARPDGTIDYLNRRWTEFTGLPQTADTEAWAQILHPDDAGAASERWATCLRSGTPFDMEIRLLDRRQQSYRWYLIRTMPVQDEAGQVVRWFGTGTDIHEQKRTEESARFLAEASRTLADVVDYASTLQKIARLAVPFFADWCTVDMAEQDGSLRRLAVAHIDPEKVRLAEELHERYPPDPNDPHGAYEVLRTGRSEMMEVIPDTLIVQGAKDEEHLRIIRGLGLKSYICVPLRGRDRTFGVLSFVSAESGRRYTKDDLAFAEELAHRSAIAVENAQLYAKLREADRRKDEFLATLAHELRNPLAPIRNSIELLRRADGNAEIIAQSSQMMERQVAQMVRLVDDLLDISRITQGKIQLRKERLELAAVVRSVVEECRPLMKAHAHKFTVTLPPDSIYVDADPTRLGQVFANLLNNAAKYTEKGGHVWLTVERQGSAVVVSVRDSGIGIAAEYLPRLFQMFSQAESALERSQGGLGIGLSLVRGLVELHGGTVEAHSEGPGSGSEFIVRLPLALSAEHAPEEPSAQPAPQLSSRRRILVVDDNEDAADSLAMMLQMMGNEVRTAHDGLEGVELAAMFRPDLVLLDIGMPRLNGYDACRRIREQPWGKNVLLVALTGWGQEEDKRRSHEAGFDTHLVKPVEPEALEKLLARVGETG